MDLAPRVYAELLPNIRQITVYISFPAVPTDADSEQTESKACSLSLSSDNNALELYYGDEVLSTNLPARAAGPDTFASVAACQLPEWPTREASEVCIRIPAVPPPGVPASGIAPFEVPWSAKAIQAGTRVCCRECHHELIPARVGEGEAREDMTWKDLPSANWAELMELWHCHKPDEPREDSENDSNSRTKGYGASNQVLCTSGTVLIDATSFYPAPEDSPIPVTADSESPDSGGEPLNCPDCQTCVGETAPLLQGYRIFKARSVLQTVDPGSDAHATWKSVPVEHLITTQLLELADRTGVRRLAVYPVSVGERAPAEETGGVLLWLFNPNVSYTTSTTASEPVQAVKILHQTLTPAELQQLINPPLNTPALVSVEDLALWQPVYEEMLACLAVSQEEVLPASVRKVVLGARTQRQEWSVGLLRCERVVSEPKEEDKR